jgi:RHS repeat-associated protein
MRTVTTPYDENGSPQTATLTAYYFGGAYEVTDGVAKSYYNFAGQTIMKDSNGDLSYFLTDHLGSVVAVTDEEGDLISQQRYLPFGGVRTNVTTPNSPNTDYGYTGQRNLDDEIGLMDYKARFYSPYLNRFIQPDSIVPNMMMPQMFNRFSYVGNNPINFNDPTGHVICDADGQCGKEKSIEAELWHHYKVKLKGNWKNKEKVAVLLGVMAVGDKFGEVLGKSGSDAFKEVFGKMTFTWGSCNECNGSGGYTYSSNDIRFVSMAGVHYPDYMLRSINNVVHELGHAFNNLWGKSPEALLQRGMANNPLLVRGEDDGYYYGFASRQNERTWVQNPSTSPSEVFADQFLGWTFNTWETEGYFGGLSAQGNARSQWMSTNMSNWLIGPGY